MNAFIDFIVRLLGDTIEMPSIFIEEVVTVDPLSAIIWALGMALTTFAVLVMAYMALGAAGIPLPRIGRGPGNQID